MIPCLKNKKAVDFWYPRLWQLKIPNNQSMGAPLTGIMDIMLQTCDMDWLLVVMAFTVWLWYIVVQKHVFNVKKKIEFPCSPVETGSPPRLSTYQYMKFSRCRTACKYLFFHEIEIRHKGISKIMLIEILWQPAIKSFFIHNKLLWYIQFEVGRRLCDIHSWVQRWCLLWSIENMLLKSDLSKPYLSFRMLGIMVTKHLYNCC